MSVNPATGDSSVKKIKIVPFIQRNLIEEYNTKVNGCLTGIKEYLGDFLQRELQIIPEFEETQLWETPIWQLGPYTCIHGSESLGVLRQIKQDSQYANAFFLALCVEFVLVDGSLGQPSRGHGIAHFEDFNAVATISDPRYRQLATHELLHAMGAHAHVFDKTSIMQSSCTLQTNVLDSESKLHIVQFLDANQHMVYKE